MVFDWTLSDNTFSQLSRTFHSILAILNNVVVCMVSTRTLISKSSRPCTISLVTVPSAPITTGITVTFMFNSFFQLPSKVQVLISLFPHFKFYSVISWNGKVHNSAGSLLLFFLFFFFFLVFFFFFFFWLSLCLVVWPRLGDPFVSQNPWKLCASHSPGRIPGCAYTICLYGQISISCTIPSGSPCPPSFVNSYNLFVLICWIRFLCDWSFPILALI